MVDVSDLVRMLDDFALSAIDAIGDEFIDRAHARSSRRSGELWNETQAEDPEMDGVIASVKVVSDVEYASYQDEGTGIYGPYGERIYPTHAKALVFDWPAAGGTVFFASVDGAPGTHYWTNTVDEFDEIVKETDVPDAR